MMNTTMNAMHLKEILVSFAKSGYLPHSISDKEIPEIVEEWILESLDDECIYEEEE